MRTFSVISAIFLAVCSLNYSTLAVQIRLAVKGLYDCKEYHLMESRNLRIRVLSGGLRAVAACEIVFHDDVTLGAGYLSVVRSGVKIAHIKIDDVCKNIRERDPNYELFFESGQIPRTCSFKKGAVYPWNGTMDFYREVIGTANAFRGAIDFRITITAVGKKDLAYCTYGYGEIKTSA